MRNRLLALLALVLAFFAAPALTQELSRKWEKRFDIAEHTDVTLEVFHLPNGTIRARGRFSNGMQTVDRTITAQVFVETEDGDAWKLAITERVPMTGLGGTEVRWKQEDIAIDGAVSEVRAAASVIDSGESFGFSASCIDGGADKPSCKLDDVSYANEDDRIIRLTSVMQERDKVDICAGFEPRTWVNATAQIGYATTCDSRTGEIAEETVPLTRDIPLCRGCPTP